MLRTKIITRNTISETQLLQALPDDFHGHVTFNADSYPYIQICIIYHMSHVDPKTVYENLTKIETYSVN
jgi:hypothetical protein